MRAIFSQLSQRYQNIGIAARSVLGQDFFSWVPQKPIYDLIDESKADYLFCESKDINQEVFYALKETNIRLVLFGFGIPHEIAGLNKTALVCCPNNATASVKQQISQIGCPSVFLMDSANITEVENASLNIESQIGFLCAYDPGMYTDYKEMISTIRKISLSDYQIKAAGPYVVPIPNYLGLLSRAEYSGFYRGCSICLDFDGLSMLDIAANKAFCISNTKNKLYPSYSSYEELTELVDQYNNPKEREEIGEAAYEAIMKSDTSLHRLNTILEALGEEEIATKTRMHLELIKNETRNNG